MGQEPSTPDATSASVRRIAEESLRAAIVAGQLLPGQRLPERMLGEMTGVGRTTVREAVRQLESEGLITVVPHRGPAVAVLSEKETRDLYALRAMLEGQAARLCAIHGTPAHASALQDAVDALERARLAGQISGAIAANADFYAALFDGAGNDALRQMLGTIQNRTALFRFSSTRWPGRAAQSVAELCAIADAVAARDADAAERAGVAHIEAAAELALVILAERARGAAQARAHGRAVISKGD